MGFLADFAENQAQSAVHHKNQANKHERQDKTLRDRIAWLIDKLRQDRKIDEHAFRIEQRSKEPFFDGVWTAVIFNRQFFIAEHWFDQMRC